MQPIHVAGLLLTGGTSARMGTDKATLPIAGETLAARVARALRVVAYPVYAVGHPAGTGLPSVTDRREGPLAAVVDAVSETSIDGPVLVVSCDLPYIGRENLEQVLGMLDDHDAAVPVYDGHAHPLCAVYAPRALVIARALVERRERAMHALLDAIDVRWFDAGSWASDVDTPEDYESAKRILDSPA